jgi:hypothetical protein
VETSYGFNVWNKTVDGRGATYVWSPGRIDYAIDGVPRGNVIWLAGITVPVGSRLKLEAVPSAGYYFQYFEINGVKITENPYEFTPNGNGDITAYYAEYPPTTVPTPSNGQNGGTGGQNGVIGGGNGGAGVGDWLKDWWWLLLLLLGFIILLIVVK